MHSPIGLIFGMPLRKAIWVTTILCLWLLPLVACAKTAKKGKRGRISGANVSTGDLRQAPVPRPSGRIAVRSPALRVSLDVNIYNDDGSYNQEALAQLDHVFR